MQPLIHRRNRDLMSSETVQNVAESNSKKLGQIAISSLKLGTIGFGGIAGMVATIEHEMVIKRKWIDHQHFMDALSASYIVPGPNAVELVMHCGKERGGRIGLLVAGICYIVPAMLICLVFGYFYEQYSALPNVQQFIFGLRPATTALVIGTIFRLWNRTLKNNTVLILLCLFVFVASLFNISEVLLIIGAGIVNYLVHSRTNNLKLFSGLFIHSGLLQINTVFSESKLFLIFLKIGAVLYGSGYVLFGYMDESLVRNNHWLSRQQLMDAIAVGQITPGPILSSATFAGYIIGGATGGVIATAGIFLPSFSISFFMHKLISSARENQKLRNFLDGLSAASISIIAVVGLHLLVSSVQQWQSDIVLAICLALTLFSKKINTAIVILVGSVTGFLLLQI